MFFQEFIVIFFGIFYLVVELNVGVLLEFFEVKEVLECYIFGIVELCQIEVVKVLILKDIQFYYLDRIIDVKLVVIDDELKELKGLGVVVYILGFILVGVILDDLEVWDIVDKYLLGFLIYLDIGQGWGFIFNFMQKFDWEVMFDEKLVKINVDFEVLVKLRVGL